MSDEVNVISDGMTLPIGSVDTGAAKMISVRNHIYLYDEIDTVTARNFAASLAEMALGMIDTALENGLNLAPIEIHINSGGGSVDDAFAIVQTIKNIQSGELTKINGTKIPIQVNTHIDGNASSAASFIACVGSHRTISKYATCLLHEVRQTSCGITEKPQDIEDSAKNMKLYKDNIADCYIEHSKLTREQLDEIMKHELNYTPQQVLDFGLVDEIV